MANNIIPINPYGSNGQVTGLTELRAKSIQMERGGLKATGAMDYTILSYNGNVRSAMLLKRNDATRIAGKTLTGFTVYEYEEDFSFIQKTENVTTLEFDSDCRYFKIAKATMNEYESAVFLFDGDVEEVYNVQMESGEVEVSGVTRLKSEMLVFGVGGSVCTTARLNLPSGYNIGGRKTPLLIWCACDGSYPGWDFYTDYVGSSPDSITGELEYFIGHGFAVLNVYPWGSVNFTNHPNCGQSGAIPVPVTLRAYEAAVKYVTTRFNISDTNIFMASWSGSGKLSAYYAINKPSFNLCHIYAFSPVIDGLCFGSWRGPQFTHMRRAIDDEMNLVGDTTQFRSTDSWTIRVNNGTEESPEYDLVQLIKDNVEKFAKCAAINWLNLSELTIAEKIAETANSGGIWQPKMGNPTTDTESYSRYELSIASDGVPITIIGAADDTACPYRMMLEFIKQLQNGGAEANIVTMPNGLGGHRAPIRDTTQSSDGSPYGWWYAAQDIKRRYLSSIGRS